MQVHLLLQIIYLKNQDNPDYIKEVTKYNNNEEESEEDESNDNFSLEDMRLEMSSYGKGDIREPFIEVVHADGSYTSDFVFEKAERNSQKHIFTPILVL